MFKKIGLILVSILIISSIASAEDVKFYNANQQTLSWDLVTTDVDGDAISGVTYRIYLIDANTDPNKESAPTLAVDNIVEPPTVVTLPYKGRFYVGVMAVWEDITSNINWGDEIEGQEAVELFGLRYASSPNMPKNLHK